jgi:pantoate--beta-alanine ligase
MILVKSVPELRKAVTELRVGGKRIAFVPTMGNLHAGHIRLVEAARRRADAVVASIYVNPLQFGANEDLAAYPRTPREDRAALTAAGTDLLFAPGDADMVPRGLDIMTRVEVPGLSDILCGASRPGHFRGVTTVVNRLFNLVQPDVALFGKKDYQQLLLIRLMVSDLGMPVEILGVDTVREPDGLAMSSRNGYLTPEQRRLAPGLYATLRDLVGQIQEQEMPAEGYARREAEAMQRLAAGGFRPDYVSVRRQVDLAAPERGDRQLVILAAAWLGRARLIDNLEVGLKPVR